MKDLKYLLLVMGLMTTTSIIAQTEGEYILEGEILGLKTPTKLYLIEWPNPDTIAKTITKDGKFSFSITRQATVSGSSIVSIHPNPMQNIMNITIHLPNAYMIVYDLQGRQVKRVQLSTGLNTINCQDMAPGSYLVKLIVNDKIIWQEQIIKQ